VTTTSPKSHGSACFFIAAAAFIAWQSYCALRLGLEVGALRAALLHYQPAPPTSVWVTFALAYGGFSWLLPIASLFLVVVAKVAGWSDTAKGVALAAMAAAAVAAQVTLTEGVYAPVVWFMNKVL
jgi:hypothetical protein